MKKLLISNLKIVILNFSLFLSLLFIIQNSKTMKKIVFLNYKSVNMPVSFIAGTSFISGSICGGFIFSLLKIKDI